MTNLIDDFLFASDAELLAFSGIALLVAAAIAMWMDRRRLKRGEIDRVGWVPWTGLFLLLAVSGGGMLALALPALLTGA
ncbi:hypothetical protein [Qipengyuania sp. MTN3-11]|uniref:hypothetical protein n=1 Tax=Qipengyuania sp. MTN3-11 TaxID=3056557 RepID=UPI0036F2879D